MTINSSTQKLKVNQLGYKIDKSTKRFVYIQQMKATRILKDDISKLEDVLNADFVSNKDNVFTFKWRI